MENTTIQIHVQLDEQKIPTEIKWKAQSIPEEQKASAFLLSLWNGEEQDTYKIDLWTKTMQKEEMIQFFQQSILSLSDTFERSTGCKQTATHIRECAEKIYVNALQELEKISRNNSR